MEVVKLYEGLKSNQTKSSEQTYRRVGAQNY